MIPGDTPEDHARHRFMDERHQRAGDLFHDFIGEIMDDQPEMILEVIDKLAGDFHRIVIGSYHFNEEWKSFLERRFEDGETG